MRKKILIMGAAGRDFHNFNTIYRDNAEYEVVAFTATQIPGIENRRYPKELAGKLYPKGIPIFAEEKLELLIKKYNIDQVDFAYSDISHLNLMHIASRVLAAGADFHLIGNKAKLKSTKPVISVCAVRTGCGKSPTSFFIASQLKKLGKRVGVIRHPMPYGNLVAQAVQKFTTYADLKKQKCTIEEMEEYERYVVHGIPIFAGVDYEKILRLAEKHSDCVLWDGGNNDSSFYYSDLQIVVVDPHRPGHEVMYHPGEVNARSADVVVISKVSTAKKEDVALVEKNIRLINPKAIIIKANLKLTLGKEEHLKGKKVLIIEDGPTLTHGEMKYGAGWEIAQQQNAIVIDPQKYALGSIKKTLQKYKHLNQILPAMGYSKKQMQELEATINKVPCDVVVIATPIDLGKLLKIKRPWVRVSYAFEEIGKPQLMKLVEKVLR